MTQKIVLFLAVFLWFPLYEALGKNSEEERKIISGYVLDANNGEPLTGASVRVKGTMAGAFCDDNGFFSISLETGNYTLICSFIGYDNIERNVKLIENISLNIELVPVLMEMKEVIIEGNKDENVNSLEIGVEQLKASTIKSIPSMMGEVDLMKVIQLFPGVQSTNEGTTGYSVRGGSPDQNLILLDEAPIYNASHLAGFFSIFNNDVVRDLRFFKGDFPAQYGGRLSSLMDVRIRDGNSEKIEGSGGIGLIASRLLLEGPIVKDKTSFLIAGRRTYADLFLPLSKNEDVKNSKLYFYDANLKINHKFNNNNSLYISGYLGHDYLKSYEFDMGFGNMTWAMKWNHIFNHKIYMTLSALQSEYDYNLGVNDNKSNDWNWKSKMSNIGLKNDFIWVPDSKQLITFGISGHYHNFSPGTSWGLWERDNDEKFTVDNNYAWEYASYISYQHQIGSKLSVRYGLRTSMFQNIGKATVYEYDDDYAIVDSTHYGSGKIYNTYFNFEPRLSINYSLAEATSVKFNYSRTNQYIQQASNSSAGSPLDIWFPAGPNIKPQQSDLFSLGFFRNFQNSMYEASLELYYKKMKNTIDFVDHADLIMNEYLDGEVRAGKSRSAGAELLIKKNEGRLTGWFGYTISQSKRTIPGINEGKTYRAPFDKPHYITIAGIFAINKKMNISANWLYASGQPITLPSQRYVVHGVVVPFYDQRNNGRFDNYHRLDLSLTYRPGKETNRRWRGEWVFSVYNAYARKNTWTMSFKQDEANPNETYAEKIWLFPVIPSVTYNFKF